jgi:hypothetical protein
MRVAGSSEDRRAGVPLIAKGPGLKPEASYRSGTTPNPMSIMGMNHPPRKHDARRTNLSFSPRNAGSVSKC